MNIVGAILSPSGIPVSATLTRAQRSRFALDPLLTEMAESESGLTADRSALDLEAPRIFAAGILAARAMIDAGKDVGFARWIHAAAVTYRDPVIGPGDVITASRGHEERESSSGRFLSVRQRERELATASVAFENPPTGRHHPHLYGIGDAPDPHTMAAQAEDSDATVLPLDIRRIDWTPLAARERGLDVPVRSWFRFTRELPDDLLLHSAALALCTDALISRNLVDINAYNAGEGNPLVCGWRPLTYSLWVHRCFRADDWILATEKIASVFGNRAFFSVTLKSSQGRHIASAVQELQLVRS